MIDTDGTDGEAGRQGKGRGIGSLFPRRSVVCLVIAFVVALYTLWMFRCPEHAMYLQLKVVAIPLGGVVYVGLASAWFEASRRSGEAEFYTPRPYVYLCLLTGIYAGAWYAVACALPMRMAFASSVAAFRGHANAALADAGYQDRFSPRFVGAYYVLSIEVIEDTVVFYTERGGTPYGFACVPSVAADRVCNGFPITGGVTISAFPKDRGYLTWV